MIILPFSKKHMKTGSSTKKPAEEISEKEGNKITTK
jgi:hypothetical protein